MLGALSIMNFIAIVLLVIVSIYVYLQIRELKDYDEMNEKYS